jgi:fructoselysine-6-P-deglycase FrlB-like protein
MFVPHAANPTLAQQQATYLAEIMAQATFLPGFVEQLTQQPPWPHLPLTDATRILGLAEGSSFYALKLARPWLTAWTGVTMDVQKPLNWLTERATRTHDWCAALMVSQSGETGSLKQVLAAQALRAVPAYVVTNNPGSSLATQVPHVLALNTPPEQSIPATLTMSASWLALLCLAVPHSASAAPVITQAVQLDWLTPQTSQHALAAIQSFTPGPMVLLGHHYTVDPLAEVALKLMETQGNLAITDRLENFSHGPKAILSSAPNVCVWADSLEGVQRAEQLKAEFPQVPLVVIGLGVRSVHLPTWALPAPISPLHGQLMTLITGQLLSWACGVHNGLSPNHPALTKHVATP